MRRQRRLRLLFLGAVALVLLFGFARPVGAQEDPGTGEVTSETPPPATDAPVTDPAVASDALVPPALDPAALPAAPPAQEAPAAPAAVGQEEGGDPLEEVRHEAEENGAEHADVECIDVIAEGGAVEDCQDAPNPLLPETNEIIWGVVGFAVVFFFVAKFGLPQIKGAMNARTEKIRNDIETAEAQREEADSLLAEYRAQLNDARAEAGQIIEEARQAADQIKRDQEARLQAELAELRERAVNDIEAAKAQAMTDLRSEVAQLAIGAAETIVGRNLDAATQTQLVDDYIDQIAARRS
jgi:F-type H+-transporting ATPase subunit b